ncbi:hypothetical protein CAPTEDRAFT_155008 [Capitella teleta]|uniref:Mitochondrial potassium channel ATP-binding subunit n=1 Tax=Capitella teleta TaxID=283909 RepID=R7U8L9_CAPTE|nr:hypothetical protein CAPTEDRAFT_155008 [Capitella teleta]|eukprot:ELU02451.1 hypothetical protein CAPTEDRAFT_155008 [Capitella teleta]
MYQDSFRVNLDAMGILNVASSAVTRKCFLEFSKRLPVPQIVRSLCQSRHALLQNASSKSCRANPGKCVFHRYSQLAKNSPAVRGELPRISGLWIGLLSVGTIGAHSLYRGKFHASCEYKSNKNRLHGLDEESSGEEVQFPWKEFFALVWPDIWCLVGAIISALAVAFINIQIPLQLGQVVNVLSSYTSETVGNFLEDIKKPATRLITLYGIQGVLSFAYISLLGAIGERVAARLRKQLFQSVITQDVAFFDTHKTGEIVNRLTADVQDFKSSFKLVISQGLRSTTQVVGCLGSLLLMSPKLTIIMAIVVPSIIGAGSLMGSGLRKLSRKAQAQVSKATAVADEAIGNLRTVRAFSMEDKEMELYNREVERSSALNQVLAVGIGIFQGLSNVALNGIVLGTMYVGGYMMSQNEIQAGDLMAFMVATQTIQRSLGQISMLFGQAIRGISAGARVFEYLSLTPSMPLKGGRVLPFHSMVGEVTFSDVCFTYPSRPNQQILTDLNFHIPAGRVVALVGLSGNGKSTIASLLERFYDVTSGKITIDGHDIRELDPSWLRGRAIGFISQEPVLFATSIMENIRYGRPEATDQEVIEAAQRSNADDFIRSFPGGYDTVLGERGVTISGGQKQRIAIARALIKNPCIIILDEATSALDAESERIVQDALDKATRGRTVLVIAHRLSTIRNADTIAVISKGQVKELGNHETLKRQKGLYWELIRKQESEETNKRSFFSQG